MAYEVISLRIQAWEVHQPNTFRNRGNVLLMDSNPFNHFLSFMGCGFTSFQNRGSILFWKVCSIWILLMSTAANISLFTKFYSMSEALPIPGVDVDIMFICGKAMHSIFRNFKCLAFILQHNQHSVMKTFQSKTWRHLTNVETLPKSSISSWLIGFGCVASTALAMNMDETDWNFHKILNVHQLLGQSNGTTSTKLVETQLEPSATMLGILGRMVQFAYHLTEFYFTGLFFVYVLTMLFMTERLISMARSACSTTGPRRRIKAAYKRTIHYLMDLVAFSSVLEGIVGDIYLQLHFDIGLTHMATLKSLMIRKGSTAIFVNAAVRIMMVLGGYQLAVRLSGKVAFFRTWITDGKTFKTLYSANAIGLMSMIDLLNQNPPGVRGGTFLFNVMKLVSANILLRLVFEPFASYF